MGTVSVDGAGLPWSPGTSVTGHQGGRPPGTISRVGGHRPRQSRGDGRGFGNGVFVTVSKVVSCNSEEFHNPYNILEGILELILISGSRFL